MDPLEEEGGGPVTLSDRQKSLIRIVQSLDPELRHTLQIECRGTEPWKLSKIQEHMDIKIAPAASGKRSDS